MSNAQNKARETRRINARRNFLANEIARHAFCDPTPARVRVDWMTKKIYEWAELTRKLRNRKESKNV